LIAFFTGQLQLTAKSSVGGGIVAQADIDVIRPHGTRPRIRMDSKAGAVTFGPGKGSPVATNYCWCSITVGDGVGVLVVSTKTFFFHFTADRRRTSHIGLDW